MPTKPMSTTTQPQQQASIDDAITAAFSSMEETQQQPETPEGQEQPEAQPEQPETQQQPETLEGQAQPEQPETQQQPETSKAARSKPPQSQPEEKAPSNWKPGAREKWASLPPEVKQEVARINREVNKLLQGTAQARRTSESFERVVQPYRPFMDGEPMEVVNDLLKTAVRLRTGSPADRAATVAAIIKGYGVDVNALADELERQQPAQPQQAPQSQPAQAQQPAPTHGKGGGQEGAQYRDPRVDQILQAMHQAKQVRATQVQQQAQAELDQFIPNAEFFEDVREDMADLMEAARRRGKPITLAQAYDKACMASEEVRALYQQRQASATAPTRAATPARGKVASSSLRNNPALPATKGKARGLDAVIDEAYQELNNP